MSEQEILRGEIERSRSGGSGRWRCPSASRVSRMRRTGGPWSGGGDTAGLSFGGIERGVCVAAAA